jgi:hypothetical protein
MQRNPAYRRAQSQRAGLPAHALCSVRAARPQCNIVRAR